MAHGGRRKPERGFYLKRDTPRDTSTADHGPAAFVFMAQDRFERVLAHDDLAYRVRRMLDALDLWTVVPEWNMVASTEYEREYFHDLEATQSLNARRYRDAMKARAWQRRLVRQRRTAQMQRVMGID